MTDPQFAKRIARLATGQIARTRKHRMSQYKVPQWPLVRKCRQTRVQDKAWARPSSDAAVECKPVNFDFRSALKAVGGW